MAKQKSSNETEFHGILLVDKPAGMTSHDVVDRVRVLFETRRVGHTGTLDPQATGLLVLLLGEATKISEYLGGVDKSYEGSFQLGVTSDTYDKEGVITPVPDAVFPKDVDAMQDLALEFTGDIIQVPPPYSAKKVGGRKLYEYARKGQSPKVQGRKLRVDDFEIISLNEDGTGDFGVDCSSGTYIRSLIHDLGQRAGCGAILTDLRRTDVGGFRIEDARTLEQLAELKTRAERREAVLPLQSALSHMPVVYLGPNSETWLRRGQAIPASMVETDDDFHPTRGAMVILCRINGDAVAIARVDPAPISPPPKVMLNAVPPWFQPLKQFDIKPTDDDDDDSE